MIIEREGLGYKNTEMNLRGHIDVLEHELAQRRSHLQREYERWESTYRKLEHDLNEAHKDAEASADLARRLREHSDRQRPVVEAARKQHENCPGNFAGAIIAGVLQSTPCPTCKALRALDAKAPPTRTTRPIGDQLLEWFSEHPPDHLGDEGVPDGYSFAAIANLANYIELPSTDAQDRRPVMTDLRERAEQWRKDHFWKGELGLSCAHNTEALDDSLTTLLTEVRREGVRAGAECASHYEWQTFPIPKEELDAIVAEVMDND